MIIPAPQRWDLGQHEGWRQFVEAERRPRPDTLTMKQLGELSDDARHEYDHARRAYHANFGVIRTPQFERAHDMLDIVLDTGLSVDDDRVKPSVVIDAPPGVGKSTAINEYLRQFERRQLRALGDTTASGNLRIPVCRIGMTAQTGLKPLTDTVLRFYGSPMRESRFTRNQLYDAIRDHVRHCETQIIAVDDVHFVDPSSKDGMAVSNFFKSWSNDLGIALVMSGVDLEGRGMYTDGRASSFGAAQNGRRWTPVGMSPVPNRGQKYRREWKDLVAAYEQQLVLANHQPLDLVSLADPIFARTQGYLVSLNHLVTRAAALAIRRGTERITEDLLACVPLDFEAESFWEGRSAWNIQR